VAEQLGLHQVWGYGAAVDGDEGPVEAGAGLVDGAGQEFLAGAGLALDQDRDGAGRDPAGAGNDPLHGGAAVDDGGELRGLRGQAGGEAIKFAVGAGEQVREEVGGDVEGDGRGAHTVLDGGFDQLGGEAGLGQDDPDRGHGGGAGAQMEDKAMALLLAGNRFRDNLAGMLVNGTEINGTFQGHVMGSGRDLGLIFEPSKIGRGLFRRVIADEFQTTESPGLQGLGDGTEANPLAFIDCSKVGSAKPTDESGSHGGGSYNT
jgi:hypothetical protein